MAIKKTTKTPAKSVKAVPTKKTTPATKAKISVEELNSEQLVVENLQSLSNLVGCLSETLDMLVQKVESMAYHIIATEEVLAEVVAANGLDLARVNARIRSKIANGTENIGDPSRAIDVAASIASPQAKARK